jgi:hypothetical protein
LFEVDQKIVVELRKAFKFCGNVVVVERCSLGEKDLIFRILLFIVSVICIEIIVKVQNFGFCGETTLVTNLR